MLNKLRQLKEHNKGFTIIEVMIVLAIAGLILLIVLLAVPALQRNSRNTTLKSDASSVVGAVGEYKSNNDGAAPATITATAVAGTSGSPSVSLKLSGGAGVTQTATPASGAIGYVIGATGACPGASAANARTVSIYYTPEGSGAATKCIEA